MTQIGKPIPSEIIQIRECLGTSLAKRKLMMVEAASVVTGKDFLMKIWGIIVTVPLGIAIIDKAMSRQTFSNIFYEIGLLQSYGKETLVIKTKSTKVPSDFVRTEYIEYDADFEDNLNKFLDTFFGLPEYFETIADQLENNPLLAIDYLRRAYLVNGDDIYRDKANTIYKKLSMKGRAKNSVETLLVRF